MINHRQMIIDLRLTREQLVNEINHLQMSEIKILLEYIDHRFNEVMKEIIKIEKMVRKNELVKPLG